MNRKTVAVLAGAAIALRVVLSLTTQPHLGDAFAFGEWAKSLTTGPLSNFYARTGSDHLPGDLYVHAGLAHLFDAGVGGDFHSTAYTIALKLTACLFDVILAALLWVTLRPIAGPTPAQLAAVAYLWSPGVLIVSSVWGQWDALSALVLVASLPLLWHRTRWPAAVPLLTWATLIKPQLVLAVGPLALALAMSIAHRRGWASVARRFAASGALALVTAWAICMPFAVAVAGSPAPGSGATTLVERIDTAAHRWPGLTLGATNVWELIFSTTWRPEDTLVAGLPAGSVGNAMVIAICGGVALVIVRSMSRRPDLDPRLLGIWGAATASYGWYMWAPRVHERYLFPAVTLLVVLAGLRRFEPRVTALAIGSGLAFGGTVMMTFSTMTSPWPDLAYRSLSASNLALFPGLLALPLTWGTGRLGSGHEPEPDLATRPHPGPDDGTLVAVGHLGTRRDRNELRVGATRHAAGHLGSRVTEPGPG